MTPELPPQEPLPPPGPDEAQFRVVSTTDLHAHIHPWDYYADRPSDTLGLARTATLIRALRAEVPNSLLLDNGDYLQGNPLGDHLAEGGLRDGDTHPVIAAMNLLGHDCGTLGNHDFNYGVPFLDRVNAGAAFPFVCANLARSLGSNPRADRTHVPPYALLERMIRDGAGRLHPLRIGVIGLLPPQVMDWDREHLHPRFAARCMIEAARAFVPEMREAGADLVIALAHTGLSPGRETAGMENAALALAAIPGIDALVTGHQHRVFPAPDFPAGDGIDPVRGLLRGVPATMAGFWGSHAGVIDLALRRDGGQWRVTGSRAGLRAIFARDGANLRPVVASAADILARTEAAHAAALAHVRRPVGRSLAPLRSYFALVADDPSLQLVARAQGRYLARMLRDTPHAGLPVLSAAAPFKAGGRAGPDYYTDVAAGPLALRNVADLYLYPNTLRGLLIDGSGLRDWLEMSAGLFRRLVPGEQDQPLLDPDFPSHNFDVIDGLTWRIDLSRPARFDPRGVLLDPDGGRITDLRFRGEPLEPGMLFIVATNSYRAAGGGNFPGITPARVIFEAPDTTREVLVRHIQEAGEIDPQADGKWGFVPLPGTSALFESSPRAAALLPLPQGPRIEPAGPGRNGFARFRLRL